MNICVYGAASNDIHPQYLAEGEVLGLEMARRGHSLIFGGGANGLMGAVVRGVSAGSGESIGIVPSFFNVDGVLYPDCTQLIYTATMRERKQLMEEKADAFILTPGGIGSFDEFFEILTLRSLGRHNKPIAILNTRGYYDSLSDLMTRAATEGFLVKEKLSLAPFFADVCQLLDWLEEMTSEQE